MSEEVSPRGESCFVRQWQNDPLVRRVKIAIAREAMRSTKFYPKCGHDPLEYNCPACAVAFWCQTKFQEMSEDDARCLQFTEDWEAELERIICIGRPIVKFTGPPSNDEMSEEDDSFKLDEEDDEL
jgi:hypothetical protein